MSEGDPLPWPAKRFPPLYAYFYMIAVPRARELGWALGLHGSLARDLDIMAMPWTEDAAPGEALVDALKELACNSYDNVTTEEKPHGRRSYAIPWEAGAYIDLSIMPRREPPMSDTLTKEQVEWLLRVSPDTQVELTNDQATAIRDLALSALDRLDPETAWKNLTPRDKFLLSHLDEIEEASREDFGSLCDDPDLIADLCRLARRGARQASNPVPPDTLKQTREAAISNITTIVETWLSNGEIECRRDEDCDHCALLSDLASLSTATEGERVPPKEWVAGFLFWTKGNEVALIRKARPDWQKGRLNGVGGKIEPGETAIAAMGREWSEETGSAAHAWKEFAVLDWEGGRVHFFSAGTANRCEFTKDTDEPVDWYKIDNVTFVQAIQNLRWLIPLALDNSETVAHLQEPRAWNAAHPLPTPPEAA